MIAGRMFYFELLSPEEKAKAIQRMAASGMSDHGIASACGLAVEQIRRLLGEAAVEHGRRA